MSNRFVYYHPDYEKVRIDKIIDEDHVEVTARIAKDRFAYFVSVKINDLIHENRLKAQICEKS